MQLADPMIDQSQQELQQFVRTYANVLNPDGTFLAAAHQFESECLLLVEEGWGLKQVSHRGSLVSPHSIVATYEKAM